MAKKNNPGQLNLFGSKPQPASKSPLPDSIPDFRTPNPKAIKLYSNEPRLPRQIFPIELPRVKIPNPTPAEAAYLAQPTGNPQEQTIILYLINHRQVPWPFSYLRVSGDTGLDPDYVHQCLKYWAWKKWYGVRRTSVGVYLAFLYHSEYFCLPH